MDGFEGVIATATAGNDTRTSWVAVIDGNAVEAIVIAVAPADTAVTTPVLLTVAIALDALA